MSSPEETIGMFSAQLFLSFTIAVSFVLIILFLIRGRRNRLLFSYVVCQFVIFWWSAGQLLELQAMSVSEKMRIVRVEYMAISVIGISWFIFCYHYARSEPFFSKRWRWLVLVFPALVNSALWTNDTHHMFYTYFDMDTRGYSAFFWLNTLGNYVFLLGGTLIMLRHLARQDRKSRYRTGVLMLAAVIPVFLNMLYVFRWVDPGFDTTPSSFSASMVLFAVASFQFRFLNILPVASRKVMEIMQEGVALFDADGFLIMSNPVFRNYCGGQMYGSQEDVVLTIASRYRPDEENLRRMKVLFTDMGEVYENEIQLSPGCIIAAYAMPLMRDSEECLGRVVTVRDITREKNLMTELRQNNHALVQANRQILQLASVAEELAVTKERNRFARDMHDTLGHSMTLVINLLETAKIQMGDSTAPAMETITQTLEIARKGMADVRRAVSGLAPENLDKENGEHALRKLCDDMRSTGVSVELTLQGEVPFEQQEMRECIYRLVQEAMTNAVRHGGASEIHVILRADGLVLRVFIFNNGRGCRDIREGYGLRGMQERVGRLGGRLTFASDGETGFNVSAEIPVHGANVYVCKEGV